MATVLTALALTRDYVPFERPPQPQTLWTAIPRGLQSGIVNNLVLDAKPLNDIQRLTCTMTLPPNFGYVMADAQLTVECDRAQDWNTSVVVELTNHYRGSSGNVLNFQSQYRQDLLDTIQSGGATVSMSVVAPWPTYPLVAPSGDTPTIVVVRASNTAAAAAAAGTVFAFVSFWQFDLEQIRKYPINSPAPTHNR